MFIYKRNSALSCRYTVLADIFGELSTSDEEDEKDVNVLDSEEDLSRQQSYGKLEDSMTDMLSLKSEMMDMSALKLDSQYLTIDNLPIDGDMTESLQGSLCRIKCLFHLCNWSRRTFYCKSVLNLETHRDK